MIHFIFPLKNTIDSNNKKNSAAISEKENKIANLKVYIDSEQKNYELKKQELEVNLLLCFKTIIKLVINRI